MDLTNANHTVSKVFDIKEIIDRIVCLFDYRSLRYLQSFGSVNHFVYEIVTNHRHYYNIKLEYSLCQAYLRRRRAQYEYRQLQKFASKWL